MATGNQVAAVTATSPGNVAVGSSSGQALAANPSRQGSLWVNNSTVTIYLNLGAAASTSSPIGLSAGGSWNGMVGDGVWTGSVYAIAASGSGNALGVIEV